VRASQSSASVHNFNWFGIFVADTKHDVCGRRGCYLASSLDCHWSGKNDEVQVLLK
jgi:hypothetical protein